MVSDGIYTDLGEALIPLISNLLVKLRLLAVAINFLNALERIPFIIEQYQKENEVLERKIP